MRSHERDLRVFVCYRDSLLRRAALAAPPGAPERYCLHGLDLLVARGMAVSHNLERSPGAVLARAARLGNRALHAAGGYGGDFGSVLASRRRLNGADVVLSTVDTVGLPLVLLRQARLVRPPLVYLAIGLPERLEQLGPESLRRRYAAALRTAHTIAAVSRAEVAAVGDWLERHGGAPRLEFLPFGVDTEHFRPQPGRAPVVDVVSIGADPRRDYGLLLAVARRLPERSFSVVASEEQARALAPVPPNVTVEWDVPFGEIAGRLAGARVVALPVRENSYSGATTVLLQAMATGKPVVVSATAAVADGYELADGVNCSLTAPGDATGFEAALRALLDDPVRAARLGEAARELAVRSFGWERYASRIHELVLAAAAAGESR